MQSPPKQIEPIQLIKFDQKKNIFLTPQAIDLFNNKLDSKELCIVCVAGKYRTGKSYILNRVLLEQNHGFEVGPTINACTKGLWMWPQVVKIDVCGHLKECIVIDTEGLGSLQQGENTDLKIFLMAMLLSSYLIYNSVGSIDQKALESLNLVINMAQLLQKSGDKFDSQQLINSFPSFMWLVRDFSLRLEDENGQVITSQQYLENALKAQKGKSAVRKMKLIKAAQKKNQIRKKLKTFFQQRDCFTLIRPTLNEKDLQNLSLLPQKKLRPQFVELIKDLRKRIHNSISPKKIRGKSITPQGFIELCNYYITNINSGKLPSINSHWDNLCISESGRLVKKYELRLKEFVDDKMVKEEEIGEFELKLFGENVLKEAFQTVEKSFLGKLEKKLLKEKLTEKLNQKLMEVFELQYKNQQELIQKSVKELFTSKDSEFQNLPSQDYQNSSQNFNFYHKIDSLKQIFNSFNKIMSEHNTSKGFQTKKSSEFIKKMYEYCFQQIQQQMIAPIEEEFFNISQENAQIREKIKRMDKTIEQTGKYDRKMMEKLEAQLEEIKRREKKMSMINDKLEQNINKLLEQNSSLHNRVQLLQTIQQEQQQKLQQFSTQSQHQSTLKQKFKLLQVSIEQLSQKQQSLRQQVKDYQIRQRKLNRQCEIYKQKFMEKQRETEEMVKEIEELKAEIERLEREKRQLIRKSSSKNLVTLKNHQSYQPLNQSLSASTMSLKQLLQQQQLQQSMIIQQNSSPEKSSSSQLQQLLTTTNELKLANKKLTQQNKHLSKLLAQQRSINALLINTPQSMNYQSLKKNYELEKQHSLQLSRKLQDFQNSFAYISQVQCLVCNQLVHKNLMISSTSTNHWVKCISSKTKSIEFDVSYVYNSEGQLNFLFDINVETHKQQDQVDSLGLFGPSELKPIKWQLPKSLKSIQLLLKLLHKPTQQITLFTSQQQDSPTKQNDTSSQQKINLNQQRRLYLDELCHTLKPQIWKRSQLIEFFAIDLHILRRKKHTKKQRSFVKKKKIGVLNLELGQITQEPQQNGTALKPYNKTLSESMNFMKTTKFSMKKVFKFGPHV